MQGSELQIPGASYDMFVSGIYNPTMNSAHDAATYEVGENGTNLYIIRNPLARWNEECTVLDSHSMHHAIALVKPKIVEVLEKYKNEELTEKRDKKAKEDEKLKRIKDLSDATVASKIIVVNSQTIDSTSDVGTSNIASSEVPQAATQFAANITVEEATTVVEEQANTNQQTENIPAQEISAESAQASSEPPTNVEMSEVADPPEQIQENSNNEQPSQVASQSENSNINQENAVDATTQASTSEEIAVSHEEATQFLLNFLSGTCNIFTIINADEKRIAVEALRISDNVQAAQELAAINVENYPQNFVFLDSELGY